jgi:hypothetical protein
MERQPKCIAYRQQWNGKLTAVRQRNTPTKVPQAPCLLENTQTRKIAWVLTRVLTFNLSHCKFAGRKAEPPFLLAQPFGMTG